jgi:hypothetical protein
VHSVFCAQCDAFLPRWREATGKVNDAFRLGDIVMDYDRTLSQRLGVRRPPALLAVRVSRNGVERRKVWSLTGRDTSRVSPNEVG